MDERVRRTRRQSHRVQQTRVTLLLLSFFSGLKKTLNPERMG